jgi:hypothetical protein
MSALEYLGVSANIWTTPSEVPVPIQFEQDLKHAAYDPKYANRLWRILVEASRVFMQFRSRFIGYASPVHFFWGYPIQPSEAFYHTGMGEFLLPYDVVRISR